MMRLYAGYDRDSQGYPLYRPPTIRADGHSNYFGLVQEGTDAESLVFFDYETTCVTLLVDSFTEFIAGLHPVRSHVGE